MDNSVHTEGDYAWKRIAGQTVLFDRTKICAPKHRHPSHAAHHLLLMILQTFGDWQER
jgi:hypothetical protein